MVQLTIDKEKVYEEVAKTTSYTGAKMVDDENAYTRIFTTDEDRLMLERFWREACAGATDLFKPFIKSVSDQSIIESVDMTSDYEVVLEISSMYDDNLTDSVQSSLFSYFVDYILARWYKITNKEEAESYGLEAAGMLDDIKSKIYYRMKPHRVEPT